MYCRACGKQIVGTSRFCAFCGAPVAAAPQPMPQQPSQPQQSSQIQQPQQAQQPWQAPQTQQPWQAAYPPQQPRQNAQPTARKSGGVTPGGALMAAMLCMLCLPYLLRALVFSAVRGSIGTPVFFLLGVLGFASADIVLLLTSKRLSGRPRLGHALLFVSVFAADLALSSWLLDKADTLDPTRSAIFFGAAILLQFALAVLLTAAAGGLLTPDGKKTGKVPAYFLALLSLLALVALPTGLELLLPERTPSFLPVFAQKAIVALAAAALLLLAVRCRKPRPDRSAAPRSTVPALLAGALLCAAAVCFSLIGGGTAAPVELAGSDIAYYIAQGDVYLNQGDAVAAVRAYEQAGEHYTAWKTTATGERYRLSDAFPEDDTLRYFSFLRADPGEVRRYLAQHLDPTQADLWLFLLTVLNAPSEEEAAEAAQPDEAAQAQLDELVRLCIGQEYFVFDYLTLDEITAQSEELLAALGEEVQNGPRLAVARAYSAMELGEYDDYRLIDSLLRSAEAYPEDLSLQYLAAYVGSSSTWDNASHYDRTQTTVLRFLDLWLELAGDDVPQETVLEMRGFCADMLMNMHRFEKAAELLEETRLLAPDDADTLQKLALCYMELDDLEKGYTLAKQMYERSPDDLTVLRTYCIGALKHGDAPEAIAAASALADAVLANSGDNTAGDLFLFNCVSYISYNDSASWTDFSYRVYNGDNTDPELLAALEKNEFLYTYVQALYWQRGQRDSARAKPFAEKLLTFTGNAGRIWYLNGMIHYDLQEFDEAKEAYLKADELEPDDPSIMFALANTCTELKEYGTAIELCRRCLDHFPNGVDHIDDQYGVSYHAAVLYRRLMSLIEEDD